MSNRKASFASALRIVDLVLLLGQRRTAWPVKDAAQALEVHPKTVLRYVEALASRLVDDDGRPLIAVEHRSNKPYLTTSGPLLAFSPQVFDYASLFLASRLLEFADGQLQRGLDRIAGSLANGLPASRRAVLERFSRKFFVYHSGWHGDVDQELMADILSGLVNERRLALRYHTWSKPKIVDPLTLAVYKEGLYLICRAASSRSRGQARIFTLTVPLIRAVEYLPKEKFRMPVQYTPQAYRADSFGMMPGTTIRVSLRARSFLEQYLTARRWHSSQKVTRQEDGWVRLTMQVAHTPELVAWICAFGPDVVVDRPVALRDEVAERLRAAVAMY